MSLPRPAPRNGPRGFTLVELLITLIVVGVLAGIAAPSMLTFIQSSRLTAAANLLQGDLQLARREAIKRNMAVLVCPVSATALVCGAVWTAGWMVCYRTGTVASDFDRCDATSATNPNPIATRAATESTLTLASLPTSAPYVRFTSDGSLGSIGSALSFTATGTWSGAKTYTWTIPVTGNISMKLS